MSKKLRDFLAGLFGQAEHSDCTIIFQIAAGERDPSSEPAAQPAQPAAVLSAAEEPEEQPLAEATDDAPQNPPSEQQEPVPDPAPAAAAAATPIGEPLPAHKLILCGGSPYFCAQLARRSQDANSSSSSGCAPPVFRVDLTSPDDLPYATSALRFVYTDQVDVDTVESVVRVRRMAGHLQIDGCAAACDAALIRLVNECGPGSGPAAALEGVATLYAQRSALVDMAEGRDGPGEVMKACRQQLVKHSYALAGKSSGGGGGGAVTVGEGGPELGDLLAWAFGDAPSLLSEPDVRQQMEALPLNAMEALLRSDQFVTDDESSVLLVAARWLHALESKLGFSSNNLADARNRLCKCVRLSQLSSTYLHVVLPALTWFPIKPDEYSFLCAFAHTPAQHRPQMITAVGGFYDFSSAWYTDVVRQRLPDGHVRRYPWYISGQKIRDALAKQDDGFAIVYGKFASGAAQAVAAGFEWAPYVQYDRTKRVAGVFLASVWPQALSVRHPGQVAAPVRPGTGKLTVYRRAERGSETKVVWSSSFDERVWVRPGQVWGDAAALPLLPEPAAVKSEAAAGEASGPPPPAGSTGSGAAAAPSASAPQGPPTEAVPAQTSSVFGASAAAASGSGTALSFGALASAVGSGPAPSFGSGPAPTFGGAPAAAFGSGPAPTFGGAPAAAFGSGPALSFGGGPAVSSFGFASAHTGTFAYAPAAVGTAPAVTFGAAPAAAGAFTFGSFTFGSVLGTASGAPAAGPNPFNASAAGATTAPAGPTSPAAPSLEQWAPYISYDGALKGRLEWVFKGASAEQ